ncbi:hypothetical protein JRO89_XS15G0033600 [Xanthoceras sorbifolium]|uniref:Uncharacterized protein n=1 Tax=Xanthoceras sorbifolium TaxID=99658 RepID=A0ABQ8H0X7_9ROSI|nr:hypothetical protein JRO89_XS15G0033600 [Xanthoceras sorbifolium]
MNIAPDSKFVYFFMAIGTSLRGFKNFMHAVILVDAIHMKGRHMGTMFVATSNDDKEMAELCNLHNNAFDYFIRGRNIDYTNLCAKYHKKGFLIDAYAETIMHVGHSEQWPILEHIKDIVVLPHEIKVQLDVRKRAGFDHQVKGLVHKHVTGVIRKATAATDV